MTTQLIELTCILRSQGCKETSAVKPGEKKSQNCETEKENSTGQSASLKNETIELKPP